MPTYPQNELAPDRPVSPKDPAAVADYVFDWSDYLDGHGNDAIDTHTITVDDGITKDSSAIESDLVRVWLSGGVAGRDYKVTCQIVTVGLRTDERTMVIKVRNR